MTAAVGLCLRRLRVASPECVKALIELGAGVNDPDPIRWTPLLMALKRGRWDVAGLLVDCGADVHWQGADSLSAVGFVRGEVGDFPDLEEMHERLDRMNERMGLQKMRHHEAQRVGG